MGTCEFSQHPNLRPRYARRRLSSETKLPKRGKRHDSPLIIYLPIGNRVSSQVSKFPNPYDPGIALFKYSAVNSLHYFFVRGASQTKIERNGSADNTLPAIDGKVIVRRNALWLRI